jgi:hypothetical protein
MIPPHRMLERSIRQPPVSFFGAYTLHVRKGVVIRNATLTQESGQLRWVHGQDRVVKRLPRQLLSL